MIMCLHYNIAMIQASVLAPFTIYMPLIKNMLTMESACVILH